jgi:hypothetical protein
MSAARRPGWVGWIPAVVLAVLVVGVIVTASVLLAGGLGQPAPKPTEGQVTDLNWSSFTDEGLEYIATSRKVRIDLSTPPVDAAALGLAADDTLVLEQIDNLDVLLNYDLILNGGGESPGGARLVASEIEIVTAGGELTTVRATISDAYGFRNTLDQLEGEAQTFGWEYDRSAIFALVEDATRAGESYEFTFGPADRVGMAVSATASCETSSYCVVVYTVTPLP